VTPGLVAGWLAGAGARLGAAASAGAGRRIVVEGATALGTGDAAGPEIWVTSGGVGTGALSWWAMASSTMTAAAGSASVRPPVVTRGLDNSRNVWRAKTRFEALTRCFLVGSGCVPVLVDQSAEDLVALDRGVAGDRGGGVVGWWVLIQALVRAVVIEVAHVAVKNSSGVSLVVDQQSVGALGADAADEPFRVAVRLGGAGRGLDGGDGFGAEDGIEGGSEFGVPVADQEAEGADLITEVHQQVAGGLGGPGRARVSGTPSRWTLRVRTSITNRT
jgi:hypothetical protein